MKIKLKHYLETLEYNESFKPERERRQVPTVTDLSQEVPVTRSQLQRIVSGDVKGIQFDVADSIIKAMRRRGFQMDVNDLLEFREDQKK